MLRSGSIKSGARAFVTSVKKKSAPYVRQACATNWCAERNAAATEWIAACSQSCCSPPTRLLIWKAQVPRCASTWMSSDYRWLSTIRELRLLVTVCWLISFARSLSRGQPAIGRWLTGEAAFFSSLVVCCVCRRRNRRIAALIANWPTRLQVQRHKSRPHRQGVVFFVVLHWSGANLRGNFG